MPTATLMRDPAMHPWVAQTVRGMEGGKVYRVDTAEESAALSAAGLPRLGDGYNLAYPALRAVDIRTRYERGGTDDAGTTLVEVRYSSDFRANPIPAKDGDAYTELETQEESVASLWDRRNLDGTFKSAPFKKFAGGATLSLLLGRTRARVSRFYSQSRASSLSWSTLIALARDHAVSADAVTLPVLRNTTVSFTLAPGQVRYHGFAVQTQGDLIQLTHAIEMAPDFYDRIGQENADGTSGAYVTVNQYPVANLNGVF